MTPAKELLICCIIGAITGIIVPVVCILVSGDG